MEASPRTLHDGSAVTKRMLMVQPDAILCKLCARGSDEAFIVLHARYRRPVFAFVFHLLNRPDAIDDAEDLTQEIFGKAFASIRGRNPQGSFKSWLFAIARNATFDHIRSRGPQSVPIDESIEGRPEFTNVVSITAQVERRAELAWLVETMRALPDRQREALVLRELAGMTHAEIAGELGASVDATKQLIKRGRKSIGEAAARNGYRSRDLGKDLAMAAPLVPLSVAGIGAGGAGAAAGVGVLATVTKLAAVTAAVVAVGSGGLEAKKAMSADVPVRPNVAAHVRSDARSAPGTFVQKRRGLRPNSPVRADRPTAGEETHATPSLGAQVEGEAPAQHSGDSAPQDASPSNPAHEPDAQADDAPSPLPKLKLETILGQGGGKEESSSDDSGPDSSDPPRKPDKAPKPSLPDLTDKLPDVVPVTPRPGGVGKPDKAEKEKS